MRAIILGCGSSVGVPIIGCKCLTCTSTISYNNRTRSAIIIEHNNQNLLIDFGPDIRQQLLREAISSIDCAILTHDHGDHVNGIDDLKIFSYRSKSPFNLYSDNLTLNSVAKRFHYMFHSSNPDDFWGVNKIRPHEIDYFKESEIAGINVQFFKQNHGKISSLGLRIKDFVYSNDVIEFPSESKIFLNNIETWVLDCISYDNTDAHAGLQKVLEWYEEFKPSKIILTNMSHKIDYYDIQKSLPKNIVPAYDGLKIEI